MPKSTERSLGMVLLVAIFLTVYIGLSILEDASRAASAHQRTKEHMSDTSPIK